MILFDINYLFADSGMVFSIVIQHYDLISQTSTTSPCQSNGNESVFHSPQITRTVATPSFSVISKTLVLFDP